MGRGALAQATALGISFGAQSYFLKNSRQAEREADLLGADIMYDTGFDPHAMAQFFTKIQQQGGARAPQFFSDHPDPGNRVQYVSAEVRTLPAKSQYRPDSADFREIKQEVSGLRPMTSQQIAERQKHGGFSGPAEATGTTGVPDAEEIPSVRMQTLSHNDFQVSYPDNWKTTGDQTSAVTIAPPNGVSQDAIAYGVMISGFQPEDSGASLDQGTHELLASLRQSNPDLREIGSDENIRVNGAAGKSVDLIGNSPLQEHGSPVRERDWLVTMPMRDSNVLYMVFISPDRDYNQLRPAFESMLRSLRLK